MGLRRSPGQDQGEVGEEEMSSNMGKKDISDYTLNEYENLAEELTGKRFAGRQLFTWIHRHHSSDFSEMTNLSKEFRSYLNEGFTIRLPRVERIQESEIDGTKKFLLALRDDSSIETVFIPGRRNTICVSSQVGCPLGCKFCLTGTMKGNRNLTPSEIAGQIYAVDEILSKGPEEFQNIVFMGMGEPFLNYENVMSGIDLICDDLGMGIAAKRITISTVGIIPGIYRLADSGSKVRLAVSLHAADSELRTRIVPVNRKYPLHELKEAMQYYAEKTGERLTLEYCLIGGVNDSIRCAKDLVTFIHELPCKINLIRYNPAPGLPQDFRTPTEEAVQAFMDYLYPRCPAVTLRKSMGSDILAACGQLANAAGQTK